MEPLSEYYHIIKDTFWSEKFWLPANFTWNDLKDDHPQRFYPQTHHLYISFPICVLLLLIRCLFEGLLFRPLGRYYGLKEKEQVPPPDNPRLDAVFKKKKRPNEEELKALSEELRWSKRKVDRWFLRKRNTLKYSLLKKFSESGWRFTFYFCSFWGGIYTLWSKPYFWSTAECWTDYPKQAVDSDTYWYYMIELGFYWSLLIFIFYDVKRKDFTEMVVHHVSTISLMIFSWSCNFVRVGTLVLAVHDAVDYWLEGAKMAKYVGKTFLCDFLFVVFTLVWLCTRLTIFPFRLLHSTIFEGLKVTGLSPFPAYYVLNGLLCTLQLLNMIWFLLIAKMMIDKLKQGQLQGDVRSDSEMSDDSSDVNAEEEPKFGNDFSSQALGTTSNGFSPKIHMEGAARQRAGK